MSNSVCLMQFTVCLLSSWPDGLIGLLQHSSPNVHLTWRASHRIESLEMQVIPLPGSRKDPDESSITTGLYVLVLRQDANKF
jgi:hypothetical protein